MKLKRPFCSCLELPDDSPVHDCLWPLGSGVELAVALAVALTEMGTAEERYVLSRQSLK